MPNLFDWIVPDRLAACVNPGMGRPVLDELRTHHIQVVINLDIEPTAAAATRNQLLTMLAQGRPDRRTAHVRSRT